MAKIDISKVYMVHPTISRLRNEHDQPCSCLRCKFLRLIDTPASILWNKAHGQKHGGWTIESPTLATPQPEYPECERMSKVSVESNKIGEFLDWLSFEKGFTICEISEDDIEGQYVPVGFTFESLLAMYYNIDLEKVEQERISLLAWMRLTMEGSE